MYGIRFTKQIFQRFKRFCANDSNLSKNISICQYLNGNFFVDVAQTRYKILENDAKNIFPGDLIQFKTENSNAIPISTIRKNYYECGVISDDKKYLIPHGAKNMQIPINRKLPTTFSETDVFRAKVSKNDDGLFCEDLDYIGDNLLTSTQEKCIFIKNYLGGFLEDAYYTLNDLPFYDFKFNDKYLYDMTDHITFCIDPFGAKDADDAISIKNFGDGNFEIGIHVTDIAQYLKSAPNIINSAIQKSNTFYLTGTCIPLLPKFAVKSLSFTHGKIQPSLSVIFKVEKNRIYDLKIVLGKISINHSISCGYAEKLITLQNDQDFYNFSQPVPENCKNTTEKLSKIFDEVRENFDCVISGNPITQESWFALKTLHSISTKLKSDRYRIFDPIVFIQPKTPEFLQKKTRSPFNEYDYPNIQSMVEEYMLYANFKIAEFLFSKRDSNVLYRKNIPAKPYNRQIHQKQLKNLTKKYENEDVASYGININLYKTMYSKFSKDCIHFSLGYPIYVHSTSPIRRVADITVHFRLRKYLCNENINLFDEIGLDSLAHLTNINENSRKRMKLKSLLVELHQFLKENGPFLTEAYFLMDYLYIPSLGISLPNSIENNDKKINKINVELVPVMTDGFMDVQASLKE